MTRRVGNRVYIGGNYYLLLGVLPTSTDEEIEKAFRKKALRYHTDKSPGGYDMFLRLEEAKRVLLDPKLRREYELERDTMDHAEEYLFRTFVYKGGNKDAGGLPPLPCGFMLSTILRGDIEKWKVKYKGVTRLGDNTEESLKGIFQGVDIARFLEELKTSKMYKCEICELKFPSEEDHDLKVLAPYVDSLFDTEGEPFDIFQLLGTKFGVDPQLDYASVVGVTFEELYEKVEDIKGAVGSGRFEEGNSAGAFVLNGIVRLWKEVKGDPEGLEDLVELLQLLLENRFGSDDHTLASGYKALLRIHPPMLLNPEIHHFFLNRYLDPTLENYEKAMGTLHYLISSQVDHSPDETRELVWEVLFESTLSQILRDAVESCDFPSLTKILARFHPGNIHILRSYLRQKSDFYNLRTDQDFRKLRGEYKVIMFLMRGTIVKVQGNFVRAREHFLTALESGTDAPMENREDIAGGVAQLMTDESFHRGLLENFYEGLQETVVHLKDTLSAGLTPANTEISPSFEIGDWKKLNIWYKQGYITIPYSVASKNEEAMKSRFSNPLDTALFYLDLSRGVGSLDATLNCFILSITNILNAMEEETSLPNLLAYRDAIQCVCAMITSRIYETHLCPPDTRLYANRFILSSQFHVIAALKRKAVPGGGDVPNEPLVSTAGGALLSLSMSEILNLVKLSPFANTPLSSLRDFTLASPPKRGFINNFIRTKVGCSSNQGVFPRVIYSQAELEGCWYGWGDEDLSGGFQVCRARGMLEHLESKGWTIDEVEGNMCWSMLRRTEGGWLNNEEKELHFSGCSEEEVYTSCSGFELNNDTGEVVLLLEKEEGKPGLFTLDDVRDIMNNGITFALFTLEDPDPSNFRLHPFQEFSYYPKTLQGTDYLMTMLHADYFLKQVTTGVEICGYFPFESRPTDEGFLQRFLEDLQKGMRPVLERVRDPIDPHSEVAHRFWIEADKVKIKETEGKGGWCTHEFDEQLMKVETKKMKRDPSSGKLVDDVDGVAFTAEQQLAQFLTKNYKAIGQHFPLLLRLAELTKLSAICDKLKDLQNHSFRVSKILSGVPTDRFPVAALYITLHEKGIEESIENFRSCGWDPPHPIYTEARVTENYMETLSLNNIPASQEHLVVSSERNRVKGEIRSALQAADEKRLANCSSQLASFCNAPEHMLRPLMRQWLDGNSVVCSQVSKICKEHWRKKEQEKCSRILLGLANIGLQEPVESPDTVELSNHGSCPWVPAAFCAEFKPPVEYEFEKEDEKEDIGGEEVDSHMFKKTGGSTPSLPQAPKFPALDSKAAETPEGIPQQNKPKEETKNSDSDQPDTSSSPKTLRNRRTGIKPSRVYGGISLRTVIETVADVGLLLLSRGRVRIPGRTLGRKSPFGGGSRGGGGGGSSGGGGGGSRGGGGGGSRGGGGGGSRGGGGGGSRGGSGAGSKLSSSTTNRNNLNYQGPTWVYYIRPKGGGNLLTDTRTKVGITSVPPTKTGILQRPHRQVQELNKRYMHQGVEFEYVVHQKDAPFQGRREAYNKENMYYQYLRGRDPKLLGLEKKTGHKFDGPKPK